MQSVPTQKLTADHLARKAVVYVRQSSERQVRHHTESQRLQYGLARIIHERPLRVQIPSPAALIGLVAGSKEKIGPRIAW